MVIEVRGIIKNIDYAKKRVEDLGAISKSYYSFTDIIYTPLQEEINLNNDFTRLRVYKENNWPTKNFILVRKKTKWDKDTKIDEIVLRQEFETLGDALNYIEDKFKGSLQKKFEYFREGWEYELGKNRIFIEDIKDFKPTVEIQSENKKELTDLFKQLEVKEILTDSVPEIIRKILKA